MDQHDMLMVEEPSRPMLLVPGVCGSILSTRKKGSKGEGDRAWVSLSEPDARYQKLWGKYSASSRLVEPFKGGEEVFVPQGDDGSGLYPISILDPDVGYGLPVIHYFDAFIDFLTSKQGYTVGKDLFGFGYDFRQSNTAHAAEFIRRLRAVRAATGRRVDIVSHSMGGLVVKSLLIDHPREFGELVANWIAIATPFGGAPGFGTDALMTGVQFAGSIGAYFFVDRGTFRQACVQSPAVYELLPPPGFPYKGEAPEIALWLSKPLPDDVASKAIRLQRLAVSPDVHPSSHYAKEDIVNTSSTFAGQHQHVSVLADPVLSSPPSNWHEVHQYTFGLSALPDLLHGVLEGNSVSVDGKPQPMPYNNAAGERAHESQDLWAAVRIPDGCRFFNLYGKGYDTPYSLQYGSWWFPVADLPSLPHANAGFTYVDGDGTVPVEAAMADGLDASERVGVSGQHRPLISMQSVWDQVIAWVKSGDPAQGEQPWHIVVPP